MAELTPIARIARWWHRDRTVCRYCREKPRLEGDRFCSDKCAVTYAREEAW